VHSLIRIIHAATSGGRLCLLTLLLFFSSSLIADAQIRLPILTSSPSRPSLVDSIPLTKLTVESRRRIEAVIGNSSVVCRLSEREVMCNKELYLHLVRNPEIAVNIWRQMGITRIQMRRDGDFHFHTRDGNGASSELELVYGSPDLHLFFAEGAFTGPILQQQLKGRCLLVLATEYRQQQGRPLVIQRMEVHAQLDDITSEFFARTLKPLVDKVVEHNFRESTRFVAQVYEAAEQNPAALERYVNRMTRVQPEIKQRFVQLISSVPARPLANRSSGSEPLRR
jgi:hypothetical protein